jgi:hypothetical protein
VERAATGRRGWGPAGGALRNLQASLRGNLLLAPDPGYDTARQVLNGAIDHEAMNAGLLTPLGTVSHKGAGRLTTGGGFGCMARRYGLALDDVTSVDIVTADGTLRHASTGRRSNRRPAASTSTRSAATKAPRDSTRTASATTRGSRRSSGATTRRTCSG